MNCREIQFQFSCALRKAEENKKWFNLNYLVQLHILFQKSCPWTVEFFWKLLGIKGTDRLCKEVELSMQCRGQIL